MTRRRIMPGAAGCYEHVGACFLNECDTAARRLAAALDGAPLPLHDPDSLERLFKKLLAAANDDSK